MSFPELRQDRYPDQATVTRLRRQGYELYLNISSTCQLRCPYCVSNMHRREAQNRLSLFRDVGAARYLRMLAPILCRYGPTDVFLGGPGEPLIEPGLPELVAGLAGSEHEIHVTTNGILLERALETVGAIPVGDLGRLSFTVSYHAGALSLRQRLAVLNTVQALTERRIRVRVLAVLSPAALAHTAELTEHLGLFATWGATLELRRLSHRLGGTRYPEAYTPAELDAMDRLVRDLGGPRFDVPGSTRLLPHLGCDLELRGWTCWAPTRILNVGLDGGLWNCYAQPFAARAQGHLVDGYDLEALYAPSARTCNYDVCSCRVLGIRYCLDPIRVSLEGYCLAYHQRAGHEASARAIVGAP